MEDYLIELFFFRFKSFKCVDIIVSFLGLGSHGSPNDAAGTLELPIGNVWLRSEC